MKQFKLYTATIILLSLLLLTFSCSKKTTEPTTSKVATPTFDVQEGIYNEVLYVEIQCSTQGATIYYTINGATPDASSLTYNAPIKIASDTIIKAQARKEGFQNSEIASISYSVDVPSVASPTFSPEGGAFELPLEVAIECATEGATIVYTTDGSYPYPSSAIYSEPIRVESDMKISAKAYRSDMAESQIVRATYLINPPIVATPTFSLPEAVYYSPQSLVISCDTPDAEIYYTIDGSEPTPESNLYTDAIQIESSKLIKARAFKQYYYDSRIATVSYIMPPQMVSVPGGTFTMGRTKGDGWDDELPIHDVTLSSFYIGKYQITQCEYEAVVGSSPAYGCWLDENYPIYNVSWYDAIKFCNSLSIAEGYFPAYSINGSTNPEDWGEVPADDDDVWDAVICDWQADGYRLPTEAEWEYAARGATNDPDYLYSGSDDLDLVAWHDANSGENPHFVGLKAPNALGTYDMSGNVSEWCWDWKDEEYYSNSPSINPTGPDSGIYRIARGGSWFMGTSLSYRVCFRDRYFPRRRLFHIGFRICRSNL